MQSTDALCVLRAAGGVRIFIPARLHAANFIRTTRRRKLRAMVDTRRAGFYAIHTGAFTHPVAPRSFKRIPEMKFFFRCLLIFEPNAQITF